MKNYGALKSIPRETTINGQFHQLSYIRPDEAELLKSLGGAGTAGPGGIPQYGLFGFSWGGNTSAPAASSNDKDDDNDSGWSFSGIAESIGNAISSGVSSVGNFVSDVGQAAADTVVEIATLGTARS